MTPYASGERWTLYAGDCLDVLRHLEPGSVHAVVTDPPYSSGGFTRSDRSADPRNKYASSDSERATQTPSFSGDNRDQRSFLLWCALWLGFCLEVATEGAPLVCFSDWRQLPVTSDAIQVGGWVWRGIVPWHKPNSRPQKGKPRAACEYMMYGSAGPMPALDEVGYLPGFVECMPPTGNKREHLTQKPVEVMRFAARLCPPDGVILDPFTGSGSTGVAALLEGRRFVGIEREPAHLEIAARRLREAESAGVQLGMLGGGL